MEAQRFPEDYDGIVSVVPVINWVGMLAASNFQGVLQERGGWLNPAKVTLLRKATTAACDAIDGLADGVISAYEKCVDVFVPRTLRCASGSDMGDSCLSDAQLEAVETLHRPFELGISLANAMTSYPGWNYGGEDQPQSVHDVHGLQPAQFPIPVPNRQGFMTYLGNGFARYFIARDRNFNPLQFRLENFSARAREISVLMDSTNPDLSAFLAHGGKLILKVNGADHQPSPFQGINYYKSVVASMGQARTNAFIRFFVVPGANHAGGVVSGTTGEAMPHSVDLLDALDGWVESDNAPETLTLVEQDAQPPFAVRASRPMCRYPLYPRYDRRGDPKVASSFTCSPQ